MVLLCLLSIPGLPEFPLIWLCFKISHLVCELATTLGLKLAQGATKRDIRKDQQTSDGDGLVILSVLEEVGIAYFSFRLSPNCCFVAVEGRELCWVKTAAKHGQPLFSTYFGEVMMPTGVTQRMGYVKMYKHNCPAQWRKIEPCS